MIGPASLLWAMLLGCKEFPVSLDTGDSGMLEDCLGPSAEVCDGLDNDCDGEIDEEAWDAPLWYTDADADGYGDPDSEVAACQSPDGGLSNGMDCDDTDESIHPDRYDPPDDDVDADCDGDDGEYGCTFLTTLAGTIVISTAEDAMMLCTEYNAVSDEVVISGALTDLSALECLCAVDELSITTNPGLVSLSGLDRLESVAGTLSITENPALTTIDDFPRLDHVSSLTIEGNSALSEISGFPGLTWVDDEVEVVGNAALTDIGGFEALLWVGDDIEIIGNGTLSDVSGFPALTHIEDDLRIDNITWDISGFTALSQIGGGLTLRDGPYYALTGFGSLSEVGTVELIDANLSSLGSAFSQLSSISRLTIDNAGITDLSGLKKLTGIGNLSVLSCRYLVTFTGIEGLTEISSVLKIRDNGVLENIGALSGVVFIGGDVTIDDNPRLRNAHIEAVLESIGADNIAGELNVNDNGG